MTAELLYNILCLFGGFVLGILTAALIRANGRDDG